MVAPPLGAKRTSAAHFIWEYTPYLTRIVDHLLPDGQNTTYFPK